MLKILNTGKVVYTEQYSVNTLNLCFRRFSVMDQIMFIVIFLSLGGQLIVCHDPIDWNETTDICGKEKMLRMLTRVCDEKVKSNDNLRSIMGKLIIIICLIIVLLYKQGLILEKSS